MWQVGMEEAATRIRARLAAYDFTGRIGPLTSRPAQPGLRAAAVLVPLLWRADGATVLFTRRNEALATHGGQVSFPGGKVEAADASATQAALRETREEIGLVETRVTVLGVLPDYATITGFMVTPVVGLVRPPVELQPEPAEVAEVFEVPLSELMLRERYRCHDYERDGVRGQYLSFDWAPQRIWGATAAISWMLAEALGMAS